jgi:hypothetical protein
LFLNADTASPLILWVVVEKLVLLVLELNPESVLLALRAAAGMAHRSRSWSRVVPLTDLLLQLGHWGVDDLLADLGLMRVTR